MPAKKNRAHDAATWISDGPPPSRRAPGATRRALALTMRDGVRIALDVHLPAQLSQDGARIPTIVCQTRYHRRDEYRRLFRPIFWLTDPFRHTLRRILGRGYAFVTVDVRGSGASSGHRRMEWSPEEVADGREVVEWIRAQPWSDGRVTTTGISYVGVAADHLCASGQAGVVAAHVRFSPFDVYADITHPGGILNARFLKAWAGLNHALDHDRPPPATPGSLGAFLGRGIRGVAPIDEDPRRLEVQRAIAERGAHYDIFEAAGRVVFRDDTIDGVRFEDFSPHAAARNNPSAGVCSVSGYFDGANTNAATKRFMNVEARDKRLVLGPWDHGGAQVPDPFSPARTSAFDHFGEVLRFFDACLHPESAAAEPPVRYFTMGEEVWRSADTWPPPGFVRTAWHLSADHRLHERPPASGDRDVFDVYEVDPRATSGAQSRWTSLANVDDARIGYPNRRAQDARCLVYQSAPLTQSVEVTGHVVVHLFMRCSTPDTHVFAYLEDVDPEGRVEYVTEGLLRALHRKTSTPTLNLPEGVPARSFLSADAAPLQPGEVAEIAFDLFAVSHLFRAGHAIRLALAGADDDNFDCAFDVMPRWEIIRTARYPSRVVLPQRTR